MDDSSDEDDVQQFFGNGRHSPTNATNYTYLRCVTGETSTSQSILQCTEDVCNSESLSQYQSKQCPNSQKTIHESGDANFTLVLDPEVKTITTNLKKYDSRQLLSENSTSVAAREKGHRKSPGRSKRFMLAKRKR